MRHFKTAFMVVMVSGAFITAVSSAVFAAGWEKSMNNELYGLPDVTNVHEGNYAKIDFGQDMYGLPHMADGHENDFAKINYGTELYGLPHTGQSHNVKMVWAKVDYGQDLYGLPHAGKFHTK